jgi:hypothetical protein
MSPVLHFRACPNVLLGHVSIALTFPNYPCSSLARLHCDFRFSLFGPLIPFISARRSLPSPCPHSLCLSLSSSFPLASCRCPSSQPSPFASSLTPSTSPRSLYRLSPSPSYSRLFYLLTLPCFVTCVFSHPFGRHPLAGLAAAAAPTIVLSLRTPFVSIK